MTAITVFDSLYCNARQVVEQVAQTTGYQLVIDPDIISEAAKLSGMDKRRLAAAFPSKINGRYDVSEHGEALGWLKLAVAHTLSTRSDLLFYGYCVHLVPPKLKNVLRVCLVSEMKERMQEGAREERCPAPEMRSRIFADDLAYANWVMAHTESNDPWDRSLYDLVLPVSSLGVGQSANSVVEQLCKVAVQHANSSCEGLEEFLLAAKAQTSISNWKNCVSVTAKGDSLTLSFIDKKQTLKAVARDLAESVSGIEGVKNVQVGTGRSFSEADIKSRPVRRASSRNRGSAQADTLLQGTPCGSKGDRELATRVKAALSLDEYPVSVHVENGSVHLTLTDHAAMLQVVARKLHDIVSRIDGVGSVDVGVVQAYYKTQTYRSVRQEVASRNLLRDDREFAPFLSERLRVDDDLSISLCDVETIRNGNDDRKPEVAHLDADLPEFDAEEGARRVSRTKSQG